LAEKAVLSALARAVILTPPSASTNHLKIIVLFKMNPKIDYCFVSFIFVALPPPVLNARIDMTAESYALEK
jgi:hypothetical protein